MKRVRMSMKHYLELTEARNWCAKKGYEGMRQWYDEELGFQTRRKALPAGVQPEVEEEPSRRMRW